MGCCSSRNAVHAHQAGDVDGIRVSQAPVLVSFTDACASSRTTSAIVENQGNHEQVALASPAAVVKEAPCSVDGPPMLPSDVVKDINLITGSPDKFAHEIVLATSPEVIVEIPLVAELATVDIAAIPSKQLAGDSTANVVTDAAATESLVAAVEAEEWEEATQLLQTRFCDPNVRTTDWGYSLLRAAAEEGEVILCRLLLGKHADVNVKDNGGMTPLMACVNGGDVPEMVSLLLEAKADVAAKADDGFTSLYYATRLDRHKSAVILRAAGGIGISNAFS